MAGRRNEIYLITDLPENFEKSGFEIVYSGVFHLKENLEQWFLCHGLSQRPEVK